MTAFSISQIWLWVALLGLAWKDEKERRIPNRTLIVLTLLWLAYVPAALWKEQAYATVLSLFLARMLAAFFVLIVTAVLSSFRPESLGMGDAKLMGVLFLYLEFSSALLLLWLSLLFTLLRGGVAHLRHRPSALPFAPQVAMAATVLLFIRRF